jgi:hypothetical protein
MTYLDDVIKKVRNDDAVRPRSVQAEVGWSEVGGCRAALGYRLDGAWATDETDNWAAIRGTALHNHLEVILADEDVRTEVETSYRGILGHADLVGRDWIGDIKTKTLASSLVWQKDPSTMRQARIQLAGYTAGLVDAGELPGDATMRLVIVPADGSFADWWLWEEPFDRSLADEGAERLEDVRRRMAAGEPLPKDKPIQFCQSYCPFFSLCRAQDDPREAEIITDPELAAAVAAYGKANAVWSAADKEKKRLAPVIRGLRGTAGEWRISLGVDGEDKDVLDEAAIAADYAERGLPVPMTTRPGSAPRMTVTKIRKASAKVPTRTQDPGNDYRFEQAGVSGYEL